MRNITLSILSAIWHLFAGTRFTERKFRDEFQTGLTQFIESFGAEGLPEGPAEDPTYAGRLVIRISRHESIVAIGHYDYVNQCMKFHVWLNSMRNGGEEGGIDLLVGSDPARIAAFTAKWLYNNDRTTDRY